MGIFHRLGSQHRSGHKGIGLIQPFLALVLIAALVIAAMQEHVAPEGGVARKQFV